MAKKGISFEQITTKGGDGGESSLYNGERRRKDDLVFHALGDIDELTSWLGLVRCALAPGLGDDLKEIQGVLVVLMGMIASPTELGKGWPEKMQTMGGTELERLETLEKRLMSEVTLPPEFILPGENEISSRIDIARTICRRAERRIVAVIRERGSVELAPCQRYVNRLSDFLFVLARYTDQHEDAGSML